MKLSFTLSGGLGDYILNYLGFPGNRLAHLISANVEIELRVSRQQKAGHDLLFRNPFFSDMSFIEDDGINTKFLPNDISLLKNLDQFEKFTPSIWLDEEEECLLRELPKPYAVYHPFASGQKRNLQVALDACNVARWVSEASGLPLIVLGTEDFILNTDRIRQIKCSPRLSVKIVEYASFFVGTHSSMQCAAWVYNIPSFCFGPSHLLFCDMYVRNGYQTYLKPLFGRNVFMMYEQASYFPRFFDHFLRKATSLLPRRSPEECRLKIDHKDMVWDKLKF